MSGRRRTTGWTRRIDDCALEWTAADPVPDTGTY